MTRKEIYPLLDQFIKEITIEFESKETFQTINAILWDFDRLIKLHEKSKRFRLGQAEEWVKAMEEFNNLLDKWAKEKEK